MKMTNFSPARSRLNRQDLHAAQRLIAQLGRLIFGDEMKRPSSISTRRVDLACQISAARRARAALFPVHLLGEPAWDIMLCLYCAVGKDEVVTRHELGRLIASPLSTISRWMDYLVERGLVEDKDDTRGIDTEICLSDNGLLGLDAYFRMLLEHDFQV